MKATLDFRLPEERSSFLEALHGSEISNAAFSFNMWLRNQLKYQDPPEELRKALEFVETQFHENFEGLLDL